MICHPIALDSMLLPREVLGSDLNVTAVSCPMTLNLQLKGSNSGVKVGKQSVRFPFDTLDLLHVSYFFCI